MKQLLPVILLACLPCTMADERPTPPAGPQPRAMQRPHAPQWARRFRPPSREQVAMRMMVRQLLLTRYDVDKDLELNDEERHQLMADAEAARKQQAQAFIRRFDVDGDGLLSPEEHKALQKALKERRNHKNDGPGKPQAQADTPPPPRARDGGYRGKRAHRPRRPHMGKEGRMVALMVQQLTMDAYDADKNGILDTAESARLREDGAKLYAAREAELLARFDRDQDGRLSDAELESAQQELFPRPKLLPAPGEVDKPQGTQGKPRPPRRGPLNRLLDTHFDLDILMNLARPRD